MKTDFQQGIITYPTSSGQQVFLAKTGSYVSLQTVNGRTDITFAHGTENYLYTESSDVPNAWGPLQPTTNYWLYWDINLLTAIRTFGFTTLTPVYGSTAPTSPAPDQHWFDTANKKMFVYQSGGWREVVRVFAAKVNGSTFTGLGSGVTGKPFAGTQVGLTAAGVSAGRIIVDNTGTPIRRANGLFFTTEDDFFVEGSPVNVIRLEANILNATALENIAKHQVVKFSHFGQINLATYNDIQTTMLAMSMEDLLNNQTGTLCAQGVIINPDWNFQTVGASLWVTGSGLLTETDPHITDPITYPVSKVPVARVLSQTSIFFDQGLGGKGDKGDAGDVSPLATELVYGISRLSVAAANPANPIVVGDNDPRLTPYTHPTTHPSTIITTAPYSFLTGATLNLQLQELANRTYTLDSLSDVAVPTPNTNDYLQWNGTNWVNAPVATGVSFALHAPTSATPQYSFEDNTTSGMTYTTANGPVPFVASQPHDMILLNVNQGTAPSSNPSALYFSTGASSSVSGFGNSMFFVCGDTTATGNFGGVIYFKTGDTPLSLYSGCNIFATSASEVSGGIINLVAGSYNTDITGGNILCTGGVPTQGGGITISGGLGTPTVSGGSVSIVGGGNVPVLRGEITVSGETYESTAGGANVFIHAGNAAVSTKTGGTLMLQSGDGFATGTAEAGHVWLTSGAAQGATRTHGNIYIQAGNTNASTTQPSTGASGGDIVLSPGRGTTAGLVKITGDSRQPQLRLQKSDTTGVTIQPSSSMVALSTYTITLPTTAGTTGQVLTTDGSGVTSWTTPAGGGGGVTITDDTTTNAFRYIPFASITSGTLSAANVSSTKLQYNPSTGTVYATNFNTTSDLNLKTNIITIGNGLSIVEQLRGVGFTWKSPEIPSFGVIAQEIEQLIPAAVGIGGDGFKTVNYNMLIPFLIEAIKELSARVYQLENK